MIKIYPRCVKEAQSYISAHGIYFPCCWIANQPTSNMVKEFLGPLFEQLDTKKYSLNEIQNSQALNKIKESWKNSNIENNFCSIFCGKDPSSDTKQGQFNNIEIQLK